MSNYVTYQTANDIYTKTFTSKTDAIKFYNICRSLGFKVINYYLN